MMSNARCSTRRLAVLAIATSLLTACATGASEPRIATVCPSVVEYSREFQARAAEELGLLPNGSAIAEMLSDYAVIREQARAVRSDKRQSTGGTNSVVRLADSWVAFVDARNVYQQLAERQGAAKNAVESALEAMKKAYLDWSAD